MNIVIVGAGNVGRALGAGWRNRGHNVTMALRDTTGEKAAALKQQGFRHCPGQGCRTGGRYPGARGSLVRAHGGR